jgi:hypothetical protein
VQNTVRTITVVKTIKVRRLHARTTTGHDSPTVHRTSFATSRAAHGRSHQLCSGSGGTPSPLCVIAKVCECTAIVNAIGTQLCCEDDEAGGRFRFNEFRDGNYGENPFGAARASGRRPPTTFPRPPRRGSVGSGLATGPMHSREDRSAMASCDGNRALLLQLLDQPLSAYWRVAQDPCGVSEVQMHARHATLQCVNETQHLLSVWPMLGPAPLARLSARGARSRGDEPPSVPPKS